MLAASAVPVRSREVSFVKPPGAMVPVLGAASSVIEVMEGAEGAAVSTVTEYEDAALTLPAASVAVALKE